MSILKIIFNFHIFELILLIFPFQTPYQTFLIAPHWKMEHIWRYRFSFKIPSNSYCFMFRKMQHKKLRGRPVLSTADVMCDDKNDWILFIFHLKFRSRFFGINNLWCLQAHYNLFAGQDFSGARTIIIISTSSPSSSRLAGRRFWQNDVQVTFHYTF